MPVEISSSSRDPAVAAKTARGRSRRNGWIVAVLVVLVLATVIALAIEHGWWKEMVAAMERMNPALLIALMALLPLGGFSIGVIYVVAGLKFGLLGGGLVIAGVTAVHVAGTFWIGRSFLRGPVMRFLARRRYELPEAPAGAETSLAAMVALVPGPPYFLRNYGLAVSGMALGKYFWVCVVIYTVRSYVTLALGDLGADPSRAGFVWLAGIFAVKITICALLIRRIRRKHREMKGSEARERAV